MSNPVPHTSAVFVARLAPGFENNPPDDLLYEVVTADGERIGSTENLMRAQLLAGALNRQVEQWAIDFAPDAVVA